MTPPKTVDEIWLKFWMEEKRMSEPKYCANGSSEYSIEAFRAGYAAAMDKANIELQSLRTALTECENAMKAILDYWELHNKRVKDWDAQYVVAITDKCEATLQTIRAIAEGKK